MKRIFKENKLGDNEIGVVVVPIRWDKWKSNKVIKYLMKSKPETINQIRDMGTSGNFKHGSVHVLENEDMYEWLMFVTLEEQKNKTTTAGTELFGFKDKIIKKILELNPNKILLVYYDDIVIEDENGVNFAKWLGDEMNDIPGIKYQQLVECKINIGTRR